MKSAVETLSPTRAKLTVEVPFEELKPSLDAAYKKIAQQINVPGFRRGKVPPMVIDRQVGRGAVLDEAINEALPEAVRRGAAGQRARAAGPAGDRHHQARGQRDPRVHRRGRRPSRGRAARLHRPRGHRRRRRRSPTRTSRSRSRTSASASRSLVRGRARRRRRRLRGHGPRGHARTARSSRAPRSAGMSYQVGKGGMLDGLDEALIGMSAGDEHDVHLAAGRRRPARRGRRGRGHGQLRQGAGAPRARRRLRPDRLGVRHRRRARPTTSAPACPAASASSRPPPPATPSSRSCSTSSRCPLPDARRRLRADGPPRADRAAARDAPA